MTLGMARVRNLSSIRELVVASDSRLSGGQFWDANPKIMLLPRTDCVLSFAGQTYNAYPLMLQAANAIETFNNLKTRSSLQRYTFRPTHDWLGQSAQEAKTIAL